MTTDPEKTIVPPSETSNAPDADEVARNDSNAGDDADATTSASANLPHGVDPAVRNAAMTAMQTVRDYAATKRA